MNRLPRGAVVLFCAVIMVPLAFGQSDIAGSKDYPGISRMPRYYIYEYSDSQFDSVTFPVKQNGQAKDVPVEGHLYKIHYFLMDNAPATTKLQVIRNFQNATRAAGGQILNDVGGDNWHNTTLRLTKGDKEVWVLVEARDDNHWVTIIEKQAMQQEVTVDAEALASDLRESGSVAIYGIYFDTGKSELKPESGPALEAIAKLLKRSPALKVFIVGHTDIVGDPAMNVKLSQARAQSVVSALATKYGIAGARLTPFGNGPYAPVASNKNEDGRAKNRRVELVEAAAR
jgi:outer membrane protein OmpA-like peptidoglycan-associated protein